MQPDKKRDGTKAEGDKLCVGREYNQFYRRRRNINGELERGKRWCTYLAVEHTTDLCPPKFCSTGSYILQGAHYHTDLQSRMMNNALGPEHHQHWNPRNEQGIDLSRLGLGR